MELFWFWILILFLIIATAGAPDGAIRAVVGRIATVAAIGITRARVPGSLLYSFFCYSGWALSQSRGLGPLRRLP